MRKSWIVIVSLALCVLLLPAAYLPSALADFAIPVVRIDLSDTTLTLEPRETWLLYASAQPENATNRRIYWDSSNRGVAVVDYAGKVVAVAPGTALITATAADGSGKTASCVVTVGAKTATPTAAPAASPSPSPTPVKGITAYPTTEKGGINMRSGPSKSSRLVTVIPNSASFTVLSYGEEWSYVQYNGRTGYVMTELFRMAGQRTPRPSAAPTVTLRPTATPRAPKGNMARVVTASGDLNMRVEPQRHAKRIYLIPQGAEIEILAYGTEWCYARYDAHTGYVQTKYLMLGSGVKKTSVAVPNVTAGNTAKPKTTATPTPQSKTFTRARKAQVNTPKGGLNLRESPSSRAARLLIIPESATVQVHSIEGNWSQVTYNGVTGYVMTKYLKIN